MTSNIVPPSTFDATKLSFGDMKSLDSGGKIVDISYDGRRNLLTQTASMVLPYGLNVYDKAGPVSYSVDVSFRGVEENPKIAAFHDMLSAFDSAVWRRVSRTAWPGSALTRSQSPRLRFVRLSSVPTLRV